MSPIPKPEKSPIQKAIKALIDETQRNGSSVIEGVIVHPADLSALKALLEEETPLPKPKSFLPLPTQPDGALTKAWREHAEQMKNAPLMPLGPGAQITGVSWDEQHRMDQTDLEQQLEDSLWALAEGIQPMRFQMDVLRHIPHMRGSSHRVRRVHSDSVDILCQCKWVMRFGRCAFTEGGRQCEEECLVPEATLLSDARCALHKGDPWKEGSRFYRCSHIGFPHDPSTRCTRVATLVHVDGTHWCNQEGHHP